MVAAKKLEECQASAMDSRLHCIYSKLPFKNVGTGSDAQRKPKLSTDAVFPYGEEAVHLSRWQFPFEADIERILGQMEEAYFQKHAVAKKFRRGIIDGCFVFFDDEIPRDWCKWNCWQWVLERRQRMARFCNSKSAINMTK